ncbi:MAG TPA: carboxypeptidase-like regulatory domain-containing protein [Verrucomicrobiales bacterium]|nr:carboxypeptidase-like regulatory domain-containing protein [Verrucomicrobiales bacterium]
MTSGIFVNFTAGLAGLAGFAVKSVVILGAATLSAAASETPGEQRAEMNLGVIPVPAPAKGEGAENEACGPGETSDEAGESAPVETVAIRGKAVDAETGEPIGALIIQAGKFDPANPDGVTWGFSESGSSARDGSFSTSVRWAEGWTARVLADGYVPEPVLTEPPPAGRKEIEVTLRLKRGRLVRGQVLDHRGDPVPGAAVYAVGPTGLNLAAGRAWTTWGEPDEKAKPVTADENGRFELPAGAASLVAVSHPGLDAWPASIPAEGELTIRLPEPSRVDVQLNIDGAEEESVVFCQLLSHLSQEFQPLGSTREVPIANGGTVSLPALPPGRYQICRRVMHRLEDVGMGGMLDRQFFELAPGEMRTIRWVRASGARIRGRITWPEDVKLSGVTVSVNAVEAEKSPFEDSLWHTTYASLAAGADGSFLTERILPGRYVLSAEGYLPLTPEQRVRTGMVGPAFRAELNIEVPATGPAEMTLEPIRLETVQR